MAVVSEELRVMWFLMFFLCLRYKRPIAIIIEIRIAITVILIIRMPVLIRGINIEIITVISYVCKYIQLLSN